MEDSGWGRGLLGGSVSTPGVDDVWTLLAPADRYANFCIGSRKSVECIPHVPFWRGGHYFFANKALEGILYFTTSMWRNGFTFVIS